MKQKLIATVRALGLRDAGRSPARRYAARGLSGFRGGWSPKAVRSLGEAERGVLICGSGVGASIAANKLPGIRAGLCHDCYSAHQGVEHDEMNVVVLGSRIIGPELANDVVKTFLGATFSNGERHVRRLEKVKNLERRFMTDPPSAS